MNEKKEIERFAKDLQRAEEYKDIGGYYIDHEGTARNLYYEGYRKVDEVRKEILREIYSAACSVGKVVPRDIKHMAKERYNIEV